MENVYISKSCLGASGKSKKEYISEVPSKILLSLFEESVLNENSSSISKYLNLIKDMKNDKKEAFFYGKLKKSNKNISYEILLVIHFLENIEKGINERKGLLKLYKNLTKLKNALPDGFDKLIKIIIAAILTSLEKKNEEVPINNLEKCLDEGRTGTILSILIILFIERKKCRIFKKEGLRMIFGNEIENSQNIDLYLSTNEEKLSLIHIDDQFARFKDYYLQKKLSKSIFEKENLVSKMISKTKSSTNNEYEELLKLFYKKCFKKVISELQKGDSIDDVISGFNEFKKEFDKLNKETIKKFEERKSYDRKIKDFFQAIEDTDGSIKKIKNLKQVLIK